MANDGVVGVLRVLLTANSAEFEVAMKKAADAAKVWSKDLKDIGRQATEIGTALTKTLTVPLTGLGVGAAKLAMDFESSFAGVRKTVQASEAEFAQMEQGFRNLSKEIPVNVNELNRLGEAAGALGIPKDQVVEFARVMAELGVTTNLTSDMAAESIAKIQNIFGAAGQDTERFASTLVALGNDGASTEQQIVSMAERIAGAGNAVGMTQGEVLAFASALSSVGIEAEMGGSAISRVFINIASSVSKGGDDVKGFATVAGMSIDQFSKLFKDDAATAVESFIKGLSNIKQSGGDLLGTLEELGFNEIRVRDTLLRTAGAGDLLSRALDLQKQAWQDNTALTKEAEQRFRTTESQMTLLWNRIKDVGITLGEALLPSIRLAIEFTTQLVPLLESMARGFGSMPAPLQMITIGLGLAAAAAGPLLWTMGQMITAAGTVAGAFTTKGIATRALTALYTPLNAATLTLTGSMTMLAGAVAGVAVAFVSWQVGRWIGETTGLTDAIGRNVLRMNEWIGWAHKGAAAQYDASVAAGKAREEHEKQAEVQKQVATITAQMQTAMQAAAAAARNAVPNIVGLNAATTASKKAADDAKEAWAKAADTIDFFGMRLDAQNANALQPYAANLSDAAAKASIFEATLPPLEASTARATVAIMTAHRWTGLLAEEMRTDAVQSVGLFTEALGNIPELLQRAFTGGGGLSGALKAFTSDIGSKLFGPDGPLGFFAGGALSGFGGKLTKMFGDSLGMILPGLGQAFGALLGPLASKVGSFFKGLFGGVSADVKEARTEIASFQQDLAKTATETQRNEAAMSGWGDRGALTLIRVRDALISLGRSGDEAQRLVTALWDTDHPERARAAMEEINRVMEASRDIIAGNQQALADARGELDRLTDESKIDWAQMRDVAEKYGVDIGSLGDQFRAGKLHDSAQQIWDDFRLLTRGGADVGGVLLGMKDEIIELALESVRFGVQIPANFKPLIDNLITSTELTEEERTALRQLGAENFGDPVVAKLDQIATRMSELIDKIGELASRLTQNVPQAAQAAAAGIATAFSGVSFDIPVNFNLGDLPGLPSIPQMGGGGIVTQPTLAMIGESGAEAVIPLDRMGGVSGGMFTDRAIVQRLDTLNARLDRFMQDQPRRIGLALQEALLLGGHA